MSVAEPLPAAASHEPDSQDLQVVRRIPVTDPADVDGSAEDWLLSGDASAAGLAELLDGLMARLVAAGMPFERATFHVGTLHPQVLGFTSVWNPRRGTCSELRVNVHVRETDEFRLSPLKLVIDERAAVRLNPRDPASAERFPMMTSLAEEGFTDYWAFPVPHARSFHTAMTVATRAPGGFRHDCVAAIQQLIPALALNLDIIALVRISENLLSAYVGERSGKRVLDGEIRRGSGETIDAIVWVSDMRGFTELSDRLPGPDMIRLLNAYFERLVEAVQDNGGEPLKFIGDGLLSIFPITDTTSAEDAAKAAIRAARQGLAAVSALNGKDGDALAIKTPWRPIDTGIALHRGSVYYGNIGAEDRLDFTVSGPAVNLASRIEPLAKDSGRRLLMTETVAGLLSESVTPLGSFTFKGVAEPVPVFAASE